MAKLKDFSFPKFKRIKTKKGKEARHFKIYLDDHYLLQCHDSDLDMLIDAINEYDGKMNNECEFSGYSICYQFLSDGWLLKASSKDTGLYIASSVNKDYLEALQCAVTSNENMINHFDELIGIQDDEDGDEMNEEELQAYWASLPKLKKKPISDLKKKKRPSDTLHKQIDKLPEQHVRYVNEFDVELAFFKSKMVNDNNFQLCGGWGFPHIEESYELCDRVIQGFKPFANMVEVFDPNTPEDKIKLKRFQDMHKACLKQKHIETTPIKIEKGWNGPYNRIEFSVCQKGTLEELFDLDALKLEYDSWVAPDGNIGNAILKKRKKQLKSYFKDWHLDDKNSKVQPWESGLILGYPVLTTIDRCYDCYDEGNVESYMEIVELHKKKK